MIEIVQNVSNRPSTQVVEHACSITNLQLGETMNSVAKDMDTTTFRVPLGVTAGNAVKEKN